MNRDNCALRFSKECPRNASFRLGNQADSGDYYCVLAHSEDGVIPGKAQLGGKSCWYTYNGEERSCEHFEWLSTKHVGQKVKLLCARGAPPATALSLGSQEDGEYQIAVAHTGEGEVPGKAKGGECWYPYQGKEHRAQHFSYVAVQRDILLLDRDSCGLRFTDDIDGVLDDAFRLGYQHDSGDYYCVLADTQFGVIPGKAQAGSETCWFSYGGEEHSSHDFEWISSNGHGVVLKSSCGVGSEVPDGTLCLGKQKREDGKYYVAVAHTDQGDIPGKAKDGSCWYPLGGKEHTAEYFSYVIVRLGNIRNRSGLRGELFEGRKIHLESQHGGFVRVNDQDEVDGHGEQGGADATYIVHLDQHAGTVRLQSVANRQRFLAVRKRGLTVGSGGRYCAFRPVFHKDGTLTLDSVNFPGRHIGINSNKVARDPKTTGTGIHARFNIVEYEVRFE